MTSVLSPKAQQLWAGFQAAPGRSDTGPPYEAFRFGDSEALSNQLAPLVLGGTKRATASLLWTYEFEHRPPPHAGSFSLVEAWSGEPLCVIETTAVALVPFAEVSAEFAAAEGEGDRSLESWRRGHWAYFGRECARIGKKPDSSMQVVCEHFEVVHRARPAT